jgi:polysaccharide export outer membrane protein
MSCKNWMRVPRRESAISCRVAAPLAGALRLSLFLLAGFALVSSAQTTGAQSAATAPAGAVPTPEKTALQNVTTPPGYRIGAGDELSINVWKEPEASVQSVVVRPDGKVTLPLVKEVDVLDLTPSELEKVLVAKLSGGFINNPDVTVVVRQIRSKKAYLVGAVNKVGPVALMSNMTVLQVLAEAGGLSDYAKRGKIYILRSEHGKQVKIPFNYDAVIRGEHMEQNIPVFPDDTIVVPH